MAFPRISIVTPSFNQAPFVEQTLRSVLDQGYPNLQYGVVDGGSTDGSIDIIQRYRPRLDFVVIEPDHGQSEAINKGLRRADGQILGWLNSDDTYLPGALRTIGRHFAEHPQCPWLIGVAKAIDAHNRDLFEVRPVGPFTLPAALIRKTRFCVPQPSTFWRRQLTDQVGLLNTAYHHCMDFDLWCRFLAAGYHPTVLDASWATYRLHPRSKSCSQPEHFVSALIDIERHYAPLLPLPQRWLLYRMIGYQMRSQAIGGGRRHLWKQVLRRPWWLASQQVVHALWTGRRAEQRRPHHHPRSAA